MCGYISMDIKKWAKDLMDQLQEDHNPTDKKVERALREAGVGESVDEMKKRQDEYAGIKRRK